MDTAGEFAEAEPLREILLASWCQTEQKQDFCPVKLNHNAQYRLHLSPCSDFASSIVMFTKKGRGVNRGPAQGRVAFSATALAAGLINAAIASPAIPATSCPRDPAPSPLQPRPGFSVDISSNPRRCVRATCRLARSRQ